MSNNGQHYCLCHALAIAWHGIGSLPMITAVPLSKSVMDRVIMSIMRASADSWHPAHHNVHNQPVHLSFALRHSHNDGQ